MGRSRRGLRLLILLFALASLAFLFFSFRYSGLGLSGFGRFFKPENSSVSWSILTEIRDMEELETAAYDMTVVFPFDFTGGEDVDWAALKLQYDWSPATFAEKADPAWHAGGRLPAEWRHAELYALCRQVGIDPGRPDHRFLVLSAAVHAGIDLEAWLNEFQVSEPGDAVSGILISEEDGRRSLGLPSPPVSVTSFVVNDRDSSAEGFPDVPLSPEEWAVLVDRLEPRLRNMALEGGLTERAALEGRTLLSEIFTAAGYDYVYFID